MTLTESVRTCLRKYFTFSGRASRSEYWKFWLFWLIVMICLLALNTAIFGPTFEVEKQVVVAEDGTRSLNEIHHTSYHSGIFGNVFALAVLVPGVAVACRRLHDVGRSGWWQLAPIVLLILGVVVSILATLGWTALLEALRETGSVKVQLGLFGLPIFLAIFGSFLLLLIWLIRPSQPGPNKYGPNPNEVTP
ncbi:DUF805 domain-containing protein [uncultured Roseobacter sp.]|uniref:DUF805 domain-containing protein n=1 Tax=uncultured Roseobacter sp. TaxID=114847 RepID=UPI00261F041B|nr:DUF805 domain-containing protein [uncultured Roseobacter sp.]